MKRPTSLITNCESDSSFNNNTTTNTTVNANSGAAPALQPMQPKAVSMLYPKKNDNQATIVSTSRSCNTPPPNSAQRSTSTPVTALLTPHLSLAAPNNTTHSQQVSKMVRSVSSLSSAPSNSMNINESLLYYIIRPQNSDSTTVSSTSTGTTDAGSSCSRRSCRSERTSIILNADSSCGGSRTNDAKFTFGTVYNNDQLEQ